MPRHCWLLALRSLLLGMAFACAGCAGTRPPAGGVFGAGDTLADGLVVDAGGPGGDGGQAADDTGDPTETGERGDVAARSDDALAVDTGTGVKWQQVSCGSSHSCGLRSDGTIGCWGAGKTVGEPMSPDHGQALPPPGQFLALSAAGADYNCAVGTDQQVVSWGQLTYFKDNALTTGPPAGALATISASWHHACGLQAQPGAIQCWGLRSAFEPLPAGNFVQVSAGQDYTCAIRADDKTVSCWGSFQVGAPPDPGAAFHAISAGPHQACGIVDADRSVVCWGPPSDLGPVTPPSGAFDAVATGGMFACGIRQGGALACWGKDLYGMGFLAPPAGSFAQVGAGSWHACAVRTDGSLACWGSNGYGRAAPP